MAKLKRPELAAEAVRLNLEQLARLGGDLRAARSRRRLTQAQLGSRVGLARSTVSDLERGRGGGHTLDAWQRLALAVDRPMRIELRRDARDEPADAGHLAIQELVIVSAAEPAIAGTSSFRAVRPMSAYVTIKLGS
jgi:transcriptional regulator with XRE-family HTH domain